MAQFVKLCSILDIPDTTMRTISMQGKRYAVAHLGEEFFVVDDTCSHEECSLGTEGFIDEYTITCGCHGAQFDVTTGDVLSLPATSPIQSYEVIIKDNDVYITL